MTRSAACRMTGSIWRTDTTTNCRTARTVHNNQVSPRPRRWRRAPPCCFFLSLSVHFPYYIYSCITVPGNIAAICREGKTAPSTRRSTVAWKWDSTSTETEFNRNYLTVNRTLCSVIKAISYLPHYNHQPLFHICITLPVESALFFIPSTSFCSLLLVHLILHASLHHSHHLRSRHLSLPRLFTPDLKLICFTDPFLHSIFGSVRTAFTDSK